MILDVILVVSAYMLGSIPFGVLVARSCGGVDLHRVGSGNIGATNVLRAVGKGAAIFTLLGDIGKGAAVVGLGRWFAVPPMLLAIMALAAVVGHLLPVFAGFRGGKGVATTLGVVLAAMPQVGSLLLVIWVAVAAIWRYSSLAALLATAAMPILAWMLDDRRPMLMLSVILVIVVFWRHRENIVRLYRGTEGKIGERAQASNSQVVK
jgi:glycerol-3-phosphate acyltransferase PlsY